MGQVRPPGQCNIVSEREAKRLPYNGHKRNRRGRVSRPAGERVRFSPERVFLRSASAVSERGCACCVKETTFGSQIYPVSICVYCQSMNGFLFSDWLSRKQLLQLHILILGRWDFSHIGVFTESAAYYLQFLFKPCFSSNACTIMRQAVGIRDPNANSNCLMQFFQNQFNTFLCLFSIA